MSSQTRQDKIRKAAADFAPHILPNIGLLKGMARMRGVKLGDFTDPELLEIIKQACQIAIDGIRVFEFKPVYAQ